VYSENEKLDEDYYVVEGRSATQPLTASLDTGFRLIENFLQEEEMAELLAHIETGHWRPDHEHKRVQVFGYTLSSISLLLISSYNYLDPNEVDVCIPAYFDSLCARLKKENLGTYDQLIISDYAAGVGLKPHVDRSALILFELLLNSQNVLGRNHY
jgi:alkylated DNA repair dioxygenase AlkB